MKRVRRAFALLLCLVLCLGALPGVVWATDKPDGMEEPEEEKNYPLLPTENDLQSTSADFSISDRGINFICAREGFHSTCYPDNTQSSIGYGTKCTGSSEQPHAAGLHSITKDAALAEMKTQINSKYAPRVRTQTTGISMNQNQFDALVSLCYNCGGGTNLIANSPLVKYLKGILNETEARTEYSSYIVNSGGKVSQGLVNRRNAEADLFFEAMSSTTTDFISFARQYLGVPYVSGGRSPSGFDCCGFVWYVCNHFGIDVGTGNQSSQINYGTVISYDKTSYSSVIRNMQPGDLLFFDYGSDGSVNHVAIYTGDGKIINAENRGVLEHSLDQSGWPDGYMWKSLCGIRRVLNGSSSQTNYYLDVNGWLDGSESGELYNYGTFDITVGGETYTNQKDFYGAFPSGTTYSISNIQSTGIHTYHGVHSGSLSGTIGSGDVSVSLNFRTNDNIGDKFYAYIKAKDGQSVLFNQGDNNVVGAPPTEDLGALWYFELVDNSKNIYKIISVKNGWALDVYGGDSTPGTDVKTYPYGNGDPAEQWVIHEENGYVLLGAVCTPCVLDAGGAVNGATANAYMNNELLNDWQWLKIEKTNPDIYSISFNPESLTMMPGENANITVKFTIANAKNYKLTNSNGDTCEVTIGSKEIDENDRSKYVVTYNVEAKSVGTSTLTFYLMDSNQNVLQTETVTVTVVPSTLTVSFNPNGGNVSPTSKTVAVGSKYGDLPTPERYNYTFAGWYTQSNGGTKVTSDTVVTSSTNHTLYAHWNELPCDASFSPSSLSLKPGESAEATLTFSGPNVSTLSLGSSNESVFTSTTLDAANNGGVCTYKLKIEAKGGGTANLILRLFDANNNVLLTKEMPVTVSSNVTSVNLNKSQLWLFLNHAQYGQEKLTATVKPDDAPNKNVTWRSTNPERVHVSSDGTVTAIEIGAENVIATSEDGGKEGACSVMVGQQIFSSKTLAVGESTYLMIVSNWVLKNYFDYSSSDPNVVSLETESYEKLNENGKTSRICKITAKSPGTTVITATPQHDKSKQLSFTVTVISNAQYTITYNANGGTGAPAAQTKTHGIPLTLSTTKPTRSGYTFLGWAAGSQYQRTVDYQPGGDFPVDQDTVLYAVWELNSCEEVIAKLTSWGNNGGTVHVGFNGSYYKVAIDAGDRVKITNLDVGSFFWFLIDDANEVAEAARVYDISYDAKGGSGAPNSQFKLHGTALTLSTMQPTRSGYTFLGWAESRSATAAQYQPGGQFTKESDTTLYAVWRANTYTVYFDPEGGTVSIENILVTYDDTYGELPTPQKAGYIFDGWYLFVNDDWKEITSDTIVDRTQNHVLYAFWRALPGAGAPNPSASITSFTRSGSKATMKVKLSGADADQVRVLLSAVDNSGRCLGVKSGTLTATGEAGVYSASVALPDGAAAYYKAFVVGAGSAPLAEAARLDA